MVEHVFERASAAQVADLSAALAGLGRDAGRKVGGVDAAELVDQLRALEELKAAAAAAQARVTVLFAAGQRAAQRQAGVRASQVGAGIAAQVGLARRDSPVRGSRHLGLAEALVAELPHTLAALEAGHISEWRATLVVRETACLSVALRRQVDAELAARPGGMAAMGDRTIELEARRVAYRLDPYAVADRARRAAGERRVTVRPAPDAMSWLTGTLPLAQGVAAYAALSRCADSARAAGDPRSRGQVMADTMVERLTGQASASAVPVEVNLTMTDTALLGGGDEPADLDGYGPVPAPVAREWLRGASEPGRAADGTGGTAGSGPSGGAGTSVGGASGIVASGVGASGVGASGVGASVGGVSGVGVSGVGVSGVGDAVGAVGTAGEQARMWLRRLYTHPETGALVAMESARRCFDGGLRRFVVARDRSCRTPWCDAPVRHVDHLVPVSAGGRTAAANAQGLCEACNYAKQAPGWSTRPLDPTGDGAGDTLVGTTTPTGHTYVSRPPPAAGPSLPAGPSTPASRGHPNVADEPPARLRDGRDDHVPRPLSPLEARLRDLLLAA